MGLDLDRVVSPPEVPDALFPGYDVWPGGDVVHVGGVDYADGIYDPSDPPFGVFHTDSSSSYVAIDNGRQLVVSPYSRGERGPMARMPLPARAATSTFTVTLRAKWAAGFFNTSGSGSSLSVSQSWGAFVGPMSDPEGGTIRASETVTEIGEREFEFVSTFVSMLPFYNVLSLKASNLPSNQHSTWHVYSVKSNIIPVEPDVTGMWPLRQRQTRAGSSSWPLRQRQNGGHSGSWPLRQRQSGV